MRHRRGKLKPATGGRAPKAQGNGGGRGKRSALQDRVARRIAGTRDLTTAGLAVRIAATHGTGVHRGSVWRLLRDLGLTHEKDLRAAGQKWPEVAAAGHIRITRRQPFMANLLTRIGFIGETRLKTDMAKTTDRAPRGARRFGHAVLADPDFHRRPPSRPACVTTALRHDRPDAPWVTDGPINRELFGTQTEPKPAPTLRPGDHCPVPAPAALQSRSEPD